MGRLVELSERLARGADPASPFTPKGASLTVGLVNGGTAVNILARECLFAFDLRTPPDLKPLEILKDFFAEADAMDAALKARFPDAGVRIETRSLTPGLQPAPDNPAEVLARRLAGDNGPPRAASYAAEAGQFQEAGYAVVICGPGSIDQAHKPDEFCALSEYDLCEKFLRKLIAKASS